MQETEEIWQGKREWDVEENTEIEKDMLHSKRREGKEQKKGNAKQRLKKEKKYSVSFFFYVFPLNECSGSGL